MAPFSSRSSIGRQARCTRARLEPGSLDQACLYLLEHLLNFGIVAHRVGRRTSQDQVGAETAGAFDAPGLHRVKLLGPAQPARRSRLGWWPRWWWPAAGPTGP